MKVKVGDKVYDADDEAVMVILTEVDKKNIQNMIPGCNKYCAYPARCDPKLIEVWMDDC